MSHRYSPHFTKREMQASDTAARRGIDNTPTPRAEANLSRLCRNYLEPIRMKFGPLRVTSGYRCPELNAAIGGSLTSAHPDGRAGDFEPLDPDVTLKEIVEWVIASGLPFDQVIYEYGAWVHLGIASEGEHPRREALMIFRGTGYMPFNPDDRRVRA